MRRALLTALALGALALPFLGVRLASSPGGDVLALRWALPCWVAGIAFGILALGGCLPERLVKALGDAGRRALDLLTSRRGAWAWLLLAAGFPFLPDAALDGITHWSVGGWQPLGWLGLDTLTNLWLYVVLALGLDLIVGRTGMLVLGYGGFYALGAYAMALLVTGFPFLERQTAFLPYWWALGAGALGGALLAALAGVLVGFPALRLKGDYLAIVTLGFGEAMALVLRNWTAVTGGTNGVNITPALLKPLARGHWAYPTGTWHYALGLAAVVLALGFHGRINRSRLGRALVALREDETAARAMGIHVPRLKLLAFALSAAWAGLAGALFAARQRFITPESFTFLESVTILVMVVLGGMGSLRGVVLGAVLVTVLQEALRGAGAYRMLVFGGLLVLMMIFRPQGLVVERRGGRR